MYRQRPIGSKICENQWQGHVQKIHKQRLKGIKKSIDNETPEYFGKLACKAKKMQLEDERLAKIELENKILVQKMAAILRAPSTLDNEDDVPKPKSLNAFKRRKELERITRENQALLERIKKQKPVYSAAKMDAEWASMEHRMKNICEYEYQLTGPGGKSPSKSESPGKGSPAKKKAPAKSEEKKAEKAEKKEVKDDKKKDDKQKKDIVKEVKKEVKKVVKDDKKKDDKKKTVGKDDKKQDDKKKTVGKDDKKKDGKKGKGGKSIVKMVKKEVKKAVKDEKKDIKKDDKEEELEY